MMMSPTRIITKTFISSPPGIVFLFAKVGLFLFPQRVAHLKKKKSRNSQSEKVYFLNEGISEPKASNDRRISIRKEISEYPRGY
jgi:hypothetical protein